ncbi:MAG: glutamate 5-kinase [Actinomycetaceae bacterium]|nr:glutamate 5-kinase [Actinomycetaceae bacterium]
MSKTANVVLDRDAVLNARRLVIKIGSSSLTTPDGGVDTKRILFMSDLIAWLVGRGKQVVLVSSGSVAAGLAPLGFKERPTDLASLQAAASVGQGKLIEAYNDAFYRHALPVGQVLLTVDDVTRQSSYRNAFRTIQRLLDLGAVPIINENDTVASNEVRFGDNDRLAALVAGMIGADAMIMLTDVDALYTKHPDEEGAERIFRVDDIDALEVDIHRMGSNIGTGGMETKMDAARICTQSGIPVFLTKTSLAERALRGEKLGTVFTAQKKRTPRRLLWLEIASQVAGSIQIDDGALRAISENRASLLAVGITAVHGDFEAGQPVEIIDSAGTAVARGLPNYSSADLSLMMGQTTYQLGETLGQEYERAVVHADVLVPVRIAALKGYA